MGKKLYTELDNTRVNKPQIIPTKIKMKEPTQELQEQMKALGYFWDGNNWRTMGTITQGKGKPSTDNRTSAQRNADYWHWWKGAKDRWTTSWNAGTNPVRASLDTGLGYVNPATAVPSAIYDAYNAYDMLSSPNGLAKTWGLIKLGKIGRAAMSAAGDMVAAADLIPGVPETPNIRRTADAIPYSTIDNIQISAVHAATPPASTIPQTYTNATGNDFNTRLLALLNTRYGSRFPLGDFDSVDFENLTPRQRIALNMAAVDNAEELSNIFDLHPDSRFLNNERGGSRFRQFMAILELRRMLRDLLYINSDIVGTALGTNTFSDNPLLQEFDLSGTGINILPASMRDLLELLENNEWNPANNAFMLKLIDGQYLMPDNYSNIHDIMYNFMSNPDIPMEYRHLDLSRDYDGSYPLEYYKGDVTPLGTTTDQLLQFGLLGDTPGLFTNEQLNNLSNKAFNRMLRISTGQGVEGAFIANRWDDTPEGIMRALLGKGSSSNDIMANFKRSQRAGYVNIPHSLSIDSWPIWEALSLRSLDKTNIIPGHLLTGTDDFIYKHMRIKNNTPLIPTNTYGVHNRIDVSPELLDFLKQNKGLSESDFSYASGDNINYKVLYKGDEVGSFRKLTELEALDKFNSVRRRIYRSKPELYPGDAEIYKPGTYSFATPFIPTQLKKQGGKINGKYFWRFSKQS